MSNTILIPLRDKTRTVIAHALIDAEDAPLAGHTWYRNTSNGYVTRLIWHNGKRRPDLLHHRVLGLTDRTLEADHINGDRLDCRRSNLRTVTHAENQQNRPSRADTSKHRNVHRSGDRWRARVQLRGTHHHVGYYTTEDEAAKAAEAFRTQHMPFSVPHRATTGANV